MRRNRVNSKRPWLPSAKRPRSCIRISVQLGLKPFRMSSARIISWRWMLLWRKNAPAPQSTLHRTRCSLGRIISQSARYRSYFQSIHIPFYYTRTLQRKLLIGFFEIEDESRDSRTGSVSRPRTSSWFVEAVSLFFLNFSCDSSPLQTGSGMSDILRLMRHSLCTVIRFLPQDSASVCRMAALLRRPSSTSTRRYARTFRGPFYPHMGISAAGRTRVRRLEVKSAISISPFLFNFLFNLQSIFSWTCWDSWRQGAGPPTPTRPVALRPLQPKWARWAYLNLAHSPIQAATGARPLGVWVWATEHLDVGCMF